MSTPEAHVADPTIQTRTTIPAGVGQINGVYAVLEGLRQGQDVLMGGYGYLEWSAAGNAIHEGLDLNSLGGGDADLGAAVVAPLAGVVTFVGWWDGRSQGFGNHLALWIDDPKASQPCFMHVAHLDSMVVWEGQRVMAGEIVGACGKSGRQPYAHVHTALWHQVPPGGWSFWQVGYSKAWVAEHTIDPQSWWWASVAKAGTHTEVPPEVDVAILNGAQQAAIQAVIWGARWNPAAADFAIPSSWRSEWVAGRWRGAPMSDEQPVPASEDKPAGAFQLFELGVAAWLPNEPVSWEG